MSETNGPSREQLRAHRQVFWDAWHKAQADLPLNALDVRIARVIKMHPEYHHYFDDMEDFLDRDFEMVDGIGYQPVHLCRDCCCRADYIQ